MIHLFLISLSFCFLISCNQQEATADAQYTEEGFDAFNADSLGINIGILSSDSFEGRKPFTPGETRTIEFLQNKFAAVGLEPGNNNSYLQEVPMVNIATVADSFMQVNSPKGNFQLKGFDDYVLWTDRTEPQISLQNTELVFAGYGVNAPERNWNDYEGLDVKGKVVMVMVNDPGYGIDPSLFRGDTMTYYGRWRYKFEEAARQGAKGCLVIHNTKAASYPFSVVQNSWNGSRLRLDDRGKEGKFCDAVGWVTEGTANKLFQQAGFDSTLFKKAAQKGFKGMSLNTKLSTNIKVSATYNKSFNVIGKITGSKHPDEYIIYSAHWDHLGIGKADEKGDSIYNGAFDNASATAGLIELARAFNKLKTKPERTIVFLAVTAEEQGLMGSEYYAFNPVYPVNKTLANINMDGLNNYGRTKDIIIVGRGQSDLEDILTDAAEKQNRKIVFEAHPEAGYYYRSDHFSFAKVGIPALYTDTGTDVLGKDADYGKKLDDEYRDKHYHRPSDEYSKEWNLEGAVEDLQLMFMVAKRISAEEKWPEWKQGSEFRDLRLKSLK